MSSSCNYIDTDELLRTTGFILTRWRNSAFIVDSMLSSFNLVDLVVKVEN